MHLKVCPNPRCGKVSEVSAAVCESCGEAFPKIALVSAGTASTEAPAGSQAQGNAPTTAGENKPRMPAWPLVMMAFVAGGLPLLWANRAQLPTPKTWQVSTPDASKASGAPQPSSSQTPPPTESAQTPAAAAAPVPPTPAQATAPSEVDSRRPAPDADTADDAKSRAHQQATGEPAKRTVRKSPKKKEPPRPCTEAVAALGLCDPKQADK